MESYEFGNTKCAVAVFFLLLRRVVLCVVLVGLIGLVMSYAVYPAELSDRRYKTTIRRISNPVETVQKLKGVKFEWIRNSEESIGFIAQDVQKVLPQIVFTDSNGHMSVAYGKVTPLLVEAIKAQQKELDAQAKKQKDLEEEIKLLKKKFRALSKR